MHHCPWALFRDTTLLHAEDESFKGFLYGVGGWVGLKANLHMYMYIIMHTFVHTLCTCMYEFMQDLVHIVRAQLHMHTYEV